MFMCLTFFIVTVTAVLYIDGPWRKQLTLRRAFQLAGQAKSVWITPCDH